MLLRAAVVAALSLTCVACAAVSPEAQSDSPKMLVGLGAPVPAAAETQNVATERGDAADDPEIWVDPKNSDRVVIFGTDKQAGLYTYDLAGKATAFIPDGKLNNVDLRDGFATPQGERVLVGASDRGRMGVALYLMNPATLTVSPWGLAKLDLTEPYGFCMGRRGDDFITVTNGTDGQVRQVKIAVGADGAMVATEERRFSVGSQTEGCVVDDAKGVLYIGEENVGVWRYDLDPASTAPRVRIAEAPSQMLKPDVEGMSLLREGEKTWLIVSSQGDSAFAVWRVDGDAPIYRGRFSVVSAAGVDGVTGTDGVAAHAGPVGPYTAGLVVMQDDVDDLGEAVTTNRVRQNFKLVDWRDVKSTLNLD
ncbi:phytase [Phenylobacterium sp. 20VBR1]|uniref:Phytase n=1 Tax=Phenylobacterium glaciei TaxID=2803784 RepID=A0A941D1Y8_9CAUL|nr:phytase [Phenylobacterium glaciei]MBR7620442.1 phytase [Phenylobacterium glaciei]